MNPAPHSPEDLAGSSAIPAASNVAGGSSSYQTAVYHIDAVPDAASECGSARSMASASSASFFAVGAYSDPDTAVTAEAGEVLAAYRSSLCGANGLDEEDGYEMYYTSGTTGRPKGVILSHRIVLSHAIGTIRGKST